MFLLRIQIRKNLCHLLIETQRNFVGRLSKTMANPASLIRLVNQPVAQFLVKNHINYDAMPVRSYTQKTEHSNGESSHRKIASKVQCWHCAKSTSLKHQMLCTECGRLQDVNQKINFFDLLNFPRKFKVETQTLTQHFRNLQAVVHPDKYSNKSEREQFNSAEWSSLINKAYKTLLTPIERGQYMLQLNGIKLPENNSVLDKEFLMTMMERNEEVEDATNAIELRQLDERINKDLNEASGKLIAAFDDSGDMEKAIDILIKMKYLLSIQQSIKTKLQSSMDKIA